MYSNYSVTEVYLFEDSRAYVSVFIAVHFLGFPIAHIFMCFYLVSNCLISSIWYNVLIVYMQKSAFSTENKEERCQINS